MMKNKIQWSILIGWLVIYLMYVCGLVYPEVWWATHFINYLPASSKYGVLIVAGVLPILIAFLKYPVIKSKAQRKYPHVLIVSIAIFMGVLFYEFSIVKDPYGESVKLQKYLEQSIDKIPDGTNESIFDFKISPWAGQQTILGIVTYIAYFSGNTYEWAFKILDVICGVLFVMLWLYFVYAYLSEGIWRFIMIIAGITAPFLLNFYGHIEINAPVYLSMLSWMLLYLSFLRKETLFKFISLLLLFFICLKFHSVNLLFLPLLLLGILKFFAPNFVNKTKLLSWKKLAIFILSPIFAGGIIAYFFIFKDYNDPRQLFDTAMEYDRLFLPIISPEAPLDKYNMFSFNHIFDYLNLMLLWSPVALLVIISISFIYRRNINWNKPTLLASGIMLLLFSSLFFVTNPLLSMQLDWDLFSYPAPFFLVFAVLLIAQIEKEKVSKFILAPALSIALLSVPIFKVHSETEMLSERLEDTGNRIYRTYYEWSAQTILFALSMEDGMSYAKELKGIIDELKPYATKNNDREYARLLQEYARHNLRDLKQFSVAEKYAKEALTYYPRMENSILYLMEANFQMQKMDAAYTYALQLLQIKHPNENTALRIAVHTAIEASYYNDALTHVQHYNKNWPGEEFFMKIEESLLNKDNIEELKLLFAKGS